MKILFSLSFLIISVSSLAHSFVIRGVTCDSAGVLIPYVNIGIVGSGVGGISDGKGEFTLSIPDSLTKEIVTFSHIQYVPYHLQVDEVDRNSLMQIMLVPQIYRIEEIEIRPEKYSVRILRKGFSIPGGARVEFGSKERTENTVETKMGVMICNPVELRSESILQAIKFRVNKCLCDSVKVRIHAFREFKGDTVEVIMPQIQTILKNSTKQDYNVVIDNVVLPDKEKLFLGIEFLEVFGEGFLKMPTYLGKGMVIEESLGDFDKIPIHFGLELIVLE